MLNFFSKHWVFRWRTEMNDYYTTNWKELHHIEGASQRVQEDTKRFAAIMEGLGVAFLDSVMTLFALFGTAVLTAVGYKMPWLEFNNQVVNAVYRKQLDYGEDDTDRITPPTVAEFFGNVRKNYYRLFFHYLYFDVAKISYLQAGVLVPCVALAPTIVAGAITLGVMQQIVRAFGRVESSLQFPVHSRSKIVKLISIYKRLQSFEAVLEGKDVPHWGSQKID